MGVVERSSANVESCISELEDSYGPFPINQTTLAVPDNEYQQARDDAQEDTVDLYAKVHNDEAEVLHVQEQGTVALPSTTASANAVLGAEAERTVQQLTGVDCSITGVEQATILGITNDEAECETVYRLAVLFEAHHDDGAVNEEAVWQQSANTPQPIVA